METLKDAITLNSDGGLFDFDNGVEHLSFTDGSLN